MSGSTIISIILCAICFGVYIGRAKGLKEAGFDRELANMKLEQCHDIIKGINK